MKIKLLRNLSIDITEDQNAFHIPVKLMKEDLHNEVVDSIYLKVALNQEDIGGEDHYVYDLGWHMEVVSDPIWVDTTEPGDEEPSGYWSDGTSLAMIKRSDLALYDGDSFSGTDEFIIDVAGSERILINFENEYDEEYPSWVTDNEPLHIADITIKGIG